MAEPLVVAHNVTKTFDSKVALDDVSAEVFPGDIIGVLGKNGAGKTTLLETVLGFSPPTQGCDCARYQRSSACRARCDETILAGSEERVADSRFAIN